MDLEQQITVEAMTKDDVETGSKLKRYVLECKKVDIAIKKTSILQQIDGAFVPGQLTALMGPSGSGKTTLMNSMSGRGLGEVVSGEILVNGKKMSKRSIRTISCLVPQLDVLFAVLTARETLNYTARLALTDLSVKERKQRVQDVVESLSLEDVQDVLVGNEDIKGLSGGERKRVSIGMEMITNPSVMFLDEPTSGLDAKIAKDVVELLKKLSAKRTVICTIHQPSFPVFSLFDKLLLLSKGRMVYNGDVDAVSAYFDHINRPVPKFSNPADHMLEVMSEVSVTKPFHEVFQESEESNVFAVFAQEASTLALELGDDGPRADLTRKEKRDAIKARQQAACSSWFTQFRVLFSRAFYIGLKDNGVSRVILKHLVRKLTWFVVAIPHASLAIRVDWRSRWVTVLGSGEYSGHAIRQAKRSICSHIVLHDGLADGHCRDASTGESYGEKGVQQWVLLHVCVLRRAHSSVVHLSDILQHCSHRHHVPKCAACSRV